MKKTLTVILILCTAMLFTMASCKNDAAPSESADKNNLPDVVTGTIVFKDYGTMKFEVYPNLARESSLNFIYLANQKFYDGIVVHRLIEDFVIQAGAYTTGYQEKKFDNPYNIIGEFSKNGIENTIKHEKGVLSWARANAFNSASTQFFICTGDESVVHLDNEYAAFGRITEGFDVIDAINIQAVDANNMPLEEIMIESVTIDSDYDFPEPDFIR